MVCGYTGNLLRVDLSRREIKIEHPEEGLIRKTIGGAGSIIYYLARELEPGTEPLSPANKLVFAAGPITGVPLAGSGRHGVGARSPLTSTLAKAESGGFWGAELKRAGFDTIIVEGRSGTPVYLWVHDGKAGLKAAEHLSGLKTKDCQEAIRRELGDRLVRVAQVGPGGEKLVRFACVVNDLHDVAGRAGMGAVMGSKNLKAIAVRGTKPVTVADPERVSRLAKWMAVEYKRYVMNFHEFGTGGSAFMQQRVLSGALPVCNFRGGDYTDKEVDLISSRELRDSGLRIGMESCFACPIRCKKVVRVDGEYSTDPSYGGPEYESLGAFGTTCGVKDLKAICKANELCNAYGLDTISAGVTVAFAMECFERGLISQKDVGFDLSFGNAPAMVRLVEMIATREGIGNILAEGSAIAAREIGHGAEDLAMHVKGLEIPMTEPRLSPGQSLNYSVNAYGADHMVGMDSELHRGTGPGIETLQPFQGNYPNDEKMHIARLRHQWRYFLDSLALCQFTPWNFQQVLEILNAVTGWDVTGVEALTIGERQITAARAFNCRDGLTAESDHLPKRFFRQNDLGPLREKIDDGSMRDAIKLFYRSMGWDQEGRPTSQKLRELGLDWLIDKERR